jgi:hypothetical protein
MAVVVLLKYGRSELVALSCQVRDQKEQTEQ